MSLANVQSGTSADGPTFTILYGVEGIGKSTFGNDAPGSIMLAAERGLKNVPVKSRFPEPKTWRDVLDAVDVLRGEKHKYQTLVIDTLDWVSYLLRQSICKSEGWSSEEFEKWGRGVKVGLDGWLALIEKLNALQDEKGMDVICLAHAWIKPFKNPAGLDYERFGMNVVGKDVADVLYRRADDVLFAHWDESTTDPKKGRVKGTYSGVRLIHTVREAAWDAKNRCNLPEVLPLDFEAYAAARVAGLEASEESMIEAATGLIGAGDYTEAEAEKILAFLEKNKKDKIELAKAINRLRARAKGGE